LPSQFKTAPQTFMCEFMYNPPTGADLSPAVKTVPAPVVNSSSTAPAPAAPLDQK